MNPTARLLKERTGDLHRRVESRLDLADPGLELTRVKTVLEYFLGFWSATEPVVDRWAAGNPAFATELSWSRRRRTDHLRRDLTVLADHFSTPVADVPVAQSVLAECDDADVLGWLYVSEGSTLGGAVIDRMLRPLLGRGPLTLRSFTPYDEGPGPMWRAYLDQLERWVGGDATRSERVVDAGVRTFSALDAWLAPLSADLAA